MLIRVLVSFTLFATSKIDPGDGSRGILISSIAATVVQTMETNARTFIGTA